MAAVHKWQFKTKFRANAYGWRGSNLAISRLKEAASEIRSVAKSDPIAAGEGVVSLSADGTVKKGGGFLGGASLSRDAEWGIASEAIQKASKAIVEKLAAGPYLARITDASGSTGGIDARVIKIDGNRAYINMGSASGIKAGDKFAIFSVGEELVDLVTGAKLGAEEKRTGRGVVTDVQQKFAIMTVTGSAKVKDVIRAER